MKLSLYLLLCLPVFGQEPATKPLLPLPIKPEDQQQIVSAKPMTSVEQKLSLVAADRDAAKAELAVQQKLVELNQAELQLVQQLNQLQNASKQANAALENLRKQVEADLKCKLDKDYQCVVEPPVAAAAKPVPASQPH